MKQEDLFLSVLESHKGILYKVAALYCKNTEDQKDLLQEMTLQLWKSFSGYKSQFKYSTWIYRITLNVAISFYRKENTRKKVFYPGLELFSNFPDLSKNTDREANILLLYQFITEFNDLEKALILLYLEEKSHKEIAEIMGITETNVSTKIGRIKEKLTKKFSQLNK